GLFMFIAGAMFFVFRNHKSVWRYASVEDLLTIVKAASAAVLIFIAAMYLLAQLATFPRSVPAIQWALLILLLGGSRCGWRFSRRWRRAARHKAKGTTIPVLLLGVNDAGEQFVRATKSDHSILYDVVGILDDAAEFQGRSIRGVPVLGRVRDLSAVVTRLAARGRKPQRLVVADWSSTIDESARRELPGLAGALGLSLARLPRLTDFKETTDDAGPELRPIALEDLLGRPQNGSDRQSIAELIAGRRVLITGAGGTIGSELTRQIASLRPARLTLLEASEFNLYSIDMELREQHPDLECRPVMANIRDRERIMQVFAEHRPELVFHAAAMKHVPMVELNPSEGVLTNVVGTRNVADAAARFGARAMVQVSTDKAVKPTSIMGASKRLAECYCQALDLAACGDLRPGEPSPRFMTVRFGNVLGSSGSVIPLFQRQLARGGPLTVTHPEIRRYFMTVREAVELVLQASAHGIEHPERRGQIFVLDMGEPVRIVDVARQMIRLAGLRPDVDVKVEITGLRPGEKLYEELFDEDEERLPAAVEGVLVAVSRTINLELLRRAFDELALASERQDVHSVRRLVNHILPSYRRPEREIAPLRPVPAGAEAVLALEAEVQ
ncbi:MAG: polysaccharide biosynthesis protein, partial [Geminicoccaceae bacterium]